jgi:hypothetical protein
MTNRVQNGVNRITEVLGDGWQHKINLEKLAMDYPCWCVVGQLFVDLKARTSEAFKQYDAGLAKLRVSQGKAEERFGFRSGAGMKDYVLLTDEWREYFKSWKEAL